MAEIASNIDLRSCDREPIHIPGSIQPHGVLLVTETGSPSVLQVAGDTERILGRSIGTICDLTIAELLGPGPAALIASAQGVSEPVYLGSVVVAGNMLCLTAHDRDGMRILEIEPSSPGIQSAAEMLAQVRNTAAIFDRAPDRTGLLQSAAREARRLTGFDRVMIYHFLRDGSGSVVAEDKAEALTPFLNHRYPASDIPTQARELYLRNLIRVIPDVNYTPSPLVPALNPATSAPLDMGECTLRSVSPIHVQYLKNMKVAASMSVSIIVDGALWGLMAFHHMAPKIVSYEMREVCKHLGQILSQQVKAREDAVVHQEMLRLAALRKKLLGALSKPGAIDRALLEHTAELRNMFPSDGAAVLFGDKLSTSNHTPSETQIRQLAGWLLDAAPSDPFVSSSLVRQYAPAAAYSLQASGLLATVVSREEPLVLMWFRAEQLETINWAGNPRKPAELDAEVASLPRASRSRSGKKPCTIIGERGHETPQVRIWLRPSRRPSITPLARELKSCCLTDHLAGGEDVRRCHFSARAACARSGRCCIATGRERRCLSWVKGGSGPDASTTSLVPQIAAELIAPARTSHVEPGADAHHSGSPAFRSPRSNQCQS